MPAIYQPPGPEYTDLGKTCYLAPFGQKVAFYGKTGRTHWAISKIPDPTILIVEAARDRAVEWTKPVDLPFDENDPWTGLHDSRERGLMVLYLDGAVREVPVSTANNVLRALFSIRSSERVPAEFR